MVALQIVSPGIPQHSLSDVVQTPSGHAGTL
jgi:hypothetical protein